MLESIAVILIVLWFPGLVIQNLLSAFYSVMGVLNNMIIGPGSRIEDQLKSLDESAIPAM